MAFRDVNLKQGYRSKEECQTAIDRALKGGSVLTDEGETMTPVKDGEWWHIKYHQKEARTLPMTKSILKLIEAVRKKDWHRANVLSGKILEAKAFARLRTEQQSAFAECPLDGDGGSPMSPMKKEDATCPNCGGPLHNGYCDSCDRKVEEDATDNYDTSVDAETREESAAPGEEDFIKKAKSGFKKEYGDKKGEQVLYATAWKRAKEKK